MMKQSELDEMLDAEYRKGYRDAESKAFQESWQRHLDRQKASNEMFATLVEAVGDGRIVLPSTVNES